MRRMMTSSGVWKARIEPRRGRQAHSRARTPVVDRLTKIVVAALKGRQANLAPSGLDDGGLVTFRPRAKALSYGNGLAARSLSLLLLVLLNLTAGCSQKPAGNNSQSAPSAAPNIAQTADANADNPALASHKVRVAAASDLQFALRDLAAQFEKSHAGYKVELTFGSSGNLYAQLTNGGPFDIFLSADMSYPRKLIEAGLAAADTEFLYAIGHIVIWVPTASSLDLEKLGIRSLADASVKKIAMANPQHAPYGRVAEAALKNLGVYDDVRDKLVLGENIAQTAQFVESGAADAGIIALSLALAPAMKDKGRYWSIPAFSYPRLEQGGVIMNQSADPGAAAALRNYLRSDEGKEILRGYGFVIPGE